MPVRERDAKFLFEQTSLITNEIKCAWQDPVIVISDEDGVNQSFF